MNQDVNTGLSFAPILAPPLRHCLCGEEGRIFEGERAHLVQLLQCQRSLALRSMVMDVALFCWLRFVKKGKFDNWPLEPILAGFQMSIGTSCMSNKGFSLKQQ